MRDLVRAKLVHSTRGRHGGFVLARDAGQISLLEIVNAVDPIRRISGCPLGNPLHARLCPLHRCLDDALAEIERSFGRTSLRSILDTEGGGEFCSRPVPLGLPTHLIRTETRP
jgi:Rrf2 family protein